MWDVTSKKELKTFTKLIDKGIQNIHSISRGEKVRLIISDFEVQHFEFYLSIKMVDDCSGFDPLCYHHESAFHIHIRHKGVSGWGLWIPHKSYLQCAKPKFSTPCRWTGTLCFLNLGLCRNTSFYIELLNMSEDIRIGERG
jgi:hypothetical protein